MSLPDRNITRLREEMLESRAGLREIAVAIAERFGCPIRQAWRLAKGMTQQDAADAYNRRYGSAHRAPMSPSRISSYERWPGAGERPSPGTLASLASVYGAAPGDLIDDIDIEHTQAPDRAALVYMRQSQRGNSNWAATTPGEGNTAPYEPGIAVSEVVVMAADNARERAGQAESREIGDATLEDYRAELIDIARAYITNPPFPQFQRMVLLRDRIMATLDRKLWPKDATELYFLSAAVHGLMAHTAHDLGSPQAAERLARAAWTYAVGIDHRPMMGYLRGRMSWFAYRQQRPYQARDLADEGCSYLSQGTGAARLYLLKAQASAELGDADGTERAIHAAEEAWHTDARDEVHNGLGGEFDFVRARLAYLAGSALAVLPGRELVAIEQSTAALREFSMGPAHERSYGCEAFAETDRATAQLRDGRLDEIDLDPVFALPPERRINGLSQRLNAVHMALTQRYPGDRRAVEIGQRIEDFAQASIARTLHELPGGG